jgi:hypothetical protein
MGLCWRCGVWDEVGVFNGMGLGVQKWNMACVISLRLRIVALFLRNYCDMLSDATHDKGCPITRLNPFSPRLS